MSDAALLSVCTIAVLALAVGGVWALARRPNKLQGVLMLVAALVLLGNILIWTV